MYLLVSCDIMWICTLGAFCTCLELQFIPANLNWHCSSLIWKEEHQFYLTGNKGMHNCINGWCLRYGSMCKKKAHAEQKAACSGCGCFVSFCMCIFLMEKVYFKDIKYRWSRCAAEARRKHWWNRQLKDLSSTIRLLSTATLSFSTPLGVELEGFFLCIPAPWSTLPSQ